ncbi:MAG TPA: hypothetical protein VNT50_06505 [Microbacterium sp.]|uniref:hypothetical protein n=1 Tax=Microbacterium sp. TaxID=51671 RepID=UPI002B783792|nr:hypothetical protein [Microbacterium sp.]HWI31121.1 hypothetical protein [Microbacterium sp.]
MDEGLRQHDQLVGRVLGDPESRGDLEPKRSLDDIRQSATVALRLGEGLAPGQVDPDEPLRGVDRDHVGDLHHVIQRVGGVERYLRPGRGIRLARFARSGQRVGVTPVGIRGHLGIEEHENSLEHRYDTGSKRGSAGAGRGPARADSGVDRDDHAARSAPGAERRATLGRVIMLLLRGFLFLLSAALGLIVADRVLPGFSIDWSDPWGFVFAVVIFAVLQSVLAPFIMKLSHRHAPALVGGIGILSTFVALLVVEAFVDGLTIGAPVVLTWILAPMIVWLVTALAAWLLPMVFIKKQVDERRTRTA